MNRLSTSRLVIRPLLPADCAAVFSYRSDPAVVRFQRWRPKDEREVRNFIREQRGLTPGLPGHWFQFGIIEQQSGNLIGDCGLHTPLDAPDSVEIGITLRAEQQDRGYASEVLLALLDYSFETLGMRTVRARTHPDNIRSIRLLARCGFPEKPAQRHEDELTFELEHRTWSDGARK